MLLSHSDRRSVNMSARMREQRKVTKGQESTARELFAVQKHYPDYDAILKACPGRDYTWARRLARKYDIAIKKHVWTTAEVSRLRKLWPDGNVTSAEMLEAFPGMTRHQIGAKATHLGLERGKPKLKSTGVPILDHLREQASRLNYSMVDLDAMAGTTTYFQKAGWHNSQGRVNYDAIVKAIEAIGGKITAVFED